MSDTFSQMQAASSDVQRHLDTITNLLHLAALLQDKNQLQIVQGILQKESEALNQDSKKLAGLMDQFKEEKRMFRIPKIPALLVIILLLALFGVVSAQDVPIVTNTPVAASVNGVAVEATLEPIPTVAAVATDAPVEKPAQTTDDQKDQISLLDTFMKYGLLIGIVTILVVGVVADRVATRLALSVPQFAWDTTKSGGHNVLTTLETRVKETPTPYDDMVLPALQKMFDDWAARVDLARAAAAPLPPGVNVTVTSNPPTAPTDTQGQVG